MAKPNYSYEKRQKEIAKKQKQEQKRLKKAAQQTDPSQDNPTTPLADETPVA